MKRLLYLIAFIPSLCFATTPFFAGTAANALHANIADKLTAGTTEAAATGLEPGTYNYYGANPVTMNSQNAVTAGTCTGNSATATTATTATNSTQLNGQSASYYATQSGLNAVILSTVTAGVQVPSIAQYNATAISTGSLQTQLNSIPTTYANLGNVITSTTSLQTQINSIGISTGYITTNFNTYVSAVNVSTTSTLQTDNNQNTAIGVLQNNLFAYGGQQILNVNFSTGTSFVNVDTTSFAPGIAISNNIILSTGNTSGTLELAYVQGGGVITRQRQPFVPTISGFLANFQLQMRTYNRGGMSGSIKLYIQDTSGNPIGQQFIIPVSSINSSVETYYTCNYSTSAGYALVYSTMSYYLYLDSYTYTDFFGGYVLGNMSSNVGSYQNQSYSYGSWSGNGSQNNFQVLITPPSGSYSVVFSSANLSIYNNGGFYTWGKFACADNQSTVTGSSITYTVAFSTNGTDTFTTPQTITNGTLLTANTPYMQYNEYFNRWVSTATPITNSASFNINYSPPLLSLSTNNVWVGSNTFTAPVAISSLTVTNLSVTIKNGATFYYSGGDYSTSSTSFIGIATMTITTSSNATILFGSQITTACNDYPRDNFTRLYIDGIGVDAINQYTTSVVGARVSQSLSYAKFGLTAGTHTISVWAKTSGGLMYLYADATSPFCMWVQEVR